MELTKTILEQLLAASQQAHTALRANHEELVTSMEHGGAQSIEVEGTLLDVQACTIGGGQRSAKFVRVTVTGRTYAQLLAVDAASDVGMQLIRLLRNAKPGLHTDINLWFLRAPHPTKVGWMCAAPLASLREEGKVLQEANEVELWRKVVADWDANVAERPTSFGALSQLRRNWHEKLLDEAAARFAASNSRSRLDQPDCFFGVTIADAAQQCVPPSCNGAANLSAIAIGYVPIERYAPAEAAVFGREHSAHRGHAEPKPKTASARSGRYGFH